MREPALGFDPNLSSQSSLLKRTRENLLSVWTLPRVVLAASHVASGAPIHLLDEPRQQTRLTGQAGSTFLHGIICAVLIYAAFHAIDKTNLNELRNSFPVPGSHYTPAMQAAFGEAPSLGTAGSGGDHNPLPPSTGEFARVSRISFGPPRLPDDKLHALPVPTTVFDANAPELTTPVKDLGLPWTPDRNNSKGAGTAGIGIGSGSTMGDALGDGSRGDLDHNRNRLSPVLSTIAA